jgi:hypothetical protein
MLTPKEQAARMARRGTAAGWRPTLVSMGDPADVAASAMPSAMRARIAAEPAPSCSPASTARIAATAPSVDTIGATIPTLPVRRAE